MLRKLDFNEARPLIYQKYLLSEDYKSRVEYLFILEELFKKNDISNLYSEFLSDNLKEIGIDFFILGDLMDEKNIRFFKSSFSNKSLINNTFYSFFSFKSKLLNKLNLI